MGITKNYSSTLKTFYEPSAIFSEVEKHIKKLDENNKPDYLTFVSNGEPTLDINLGNQLRN